MRWHHFFYLTIAIFLSFVAASLAHFTEGSKPRTILIADGEDKGLLVYLRVPAPLFFAGDIVDAQNRQVPFEAQFLTVNRVGNALAFSLSQSDISDNPNDFSDRLNAAHIFRQAGRPLEARVLRWAIHSDLPKTSLSSVAEAREALSTPVLEVDPSFGAAYIDVELALDEAEKRLDLQVKSALPFVILPPSVSIDNHIRDLRGNSAVSIRETGQLQDWVTVDGSSLRAGLLFVWQGILHILLGTDHVLFVVCIALGAGAWRKLVLRVTAFTLGHAVTLVIAFLGYVPNATWFIPAVETAIAATVVYAALAAWLQRMDAPWVLLVTGLLHGLGFSFVLSEILGPGSPALSLSLASFTLGIEFGQLALLALVLAAMAGIGTMSFQGARALRLMALGVSGSIAVYWTLTRGLELLSVV